jgi:hypothetical protein
MKIPLASPVFENKQLDVKPDIMHITFPEQTQTDFVSSSVQYIERFSPELVLMESTVTLGTTLAIHNKLEKKTLLCHSPVRGNMTDGMKKGLHLGNAQDWVTCTFLMMQGSASAPEGKIR